MSSDKNVIRMDDPYETIGFALKRAQQALRTHMDGALQQIGLTTPQYAVLTFLEVEPGASNASLARRAFVTPQTMQGILVALERDGLISRTPHSDHGRVLTTKLTERGRDTLKAASGIVVEVEARLLDASAPLDARTVTSLLRRFAETLR